MIVQRFLAWVQTAPAGARAEATSAMARAYLYSDLDDRDRDDAETALTAMLDDPSPLVRRALAEAFASAREAPRHCVAALAADQSDIAAVVLARSPLLSDAELIDHAAVGDAFAQSAIALRPTLSAPVALALAEIAGREALITLAVNAGADVPEAALRRMIERFGDDGELREAILGRPDLPASLRFDLVGATASALADFVASRGWMPEERARRVARDSTEKGAVLIAVESSRRDDPSLPGLARRLRVSGRLTAGLALRAVLSGAGDLFETILVELSGLPPAKVAGLVARPAGGGFASLYAKAGLPPPLLPVFRAALVEINQGGPAGKSDGALRSALVARARETCQRETSAPAEAMAMLRRFDVEASREEARQASARLIARGSPPKPSAPTLEIDLAALEAELAAA